MGAAAVPPVAVAAIAAGDADAAGFLAADGVEAFVAAASLVAGGCAPFAPDPTPFFAPRGANSGAGSGTGGGVSSSASASAATGFAWTAPAVLLSNLPCTPVGCTLSATDSVNTHQT